MTSTRPAIIEITADSRSLGARLREASAKMASFAASSARVVGRYGAASAATLGGPLVDPKFYAGLGKYARTGVAVAGAALVVAASQVRDFEEGLVRLQINADASGEAMDNVRRSIRAASSATAIGSAQILDGVAKYVDLTGDFEGATRQVATFARVAQASGSAVADVAQTAAALQDALKIRPEDMEAAFSALTVQGKKGSVTMRQMASELSQLAPTMAQFKGGTGLGGLRQLGAALQIINKRYNNASESATAFQSMAIALQSHAGKLEKAGVDVFDVGPDGVKRLKDLFTIIDNIGRSKLMKDSGLLIKTLGRAEAVFPIQQLVRMRDELEQLKKVGEDAGAIARDLKTYQDSKPGKFNKYTNDLKEGAQGVAVDVIERGIKGYGGWRAALSGALDNTRGEASTLSGEEGKRRGYAARVMFRYAQKGQIIDPAQAEQLATAEGYLATQKLFSSFGLAPRVTDEQRAQLRDQYGTVRGADGGTASVDLAGNLSTTSPTGLAIILERAVRDGIKSSGLSIPVGEAANAVLGVVGKATGHRRRPGG